MDEGYFINREAKMVARELDHGDALSAANLLREDCQHMSPREFTNLVTQAARIEKPGGADLQIQRDGDIVIHGADGRRYNGGRIPSEEACRILPQPPVVIVERREPPRRQPEVVIVHEPPRRQPEVIIIDRDRRDQHPPRGYDPNLRGAKEIVDGTAKVIKGILDVNQDNRR